MGVNKDSVVLFTSGQKLIEGKTLMKATLEFPTVTEQDKRPVLGSSTHHLQVLLLFKLTKNNKLLTVLVLYNKDKTALVPLDILIFAVAPS